MGRIDFALAAAIGTAANADDGPAIERGEAARPWAKTQIASAAARSAGRPGPGRPGCLLFQYMSGLDFQWKSALMKYCLANDLHALNACAEISAEEYTAICSSLANLRRMLIIEDQRDLVLENYIELENELLSIATRHMISATFDYELFQRDRNLIANRRLSNLLSACRGYLDHAPYHVDSL